MEGIVPYIPSGCVPLNGVRGKPSGFGRLVAAPTGALGCVPSNAAGWIDGARFRFPPQKRYRAGQGTNVSVPSQSVTKKGEKNEGSEIGRAHV